MHGAGVKGSWLARAAFSSRLAGGWNLLVSVTRAPAWWEHKVPVFLAVAYLTACAEGISLDQLWPRLVIVLAALVAAASYVSVLNDITDLAEDTRAKKPNQMAGRTAGFKTASLSACLLAGLLCAWLMRTSPISVTLYAANWMAFTLYSVPPLRLKTRGIFGVLADACGGQFLPTLWTSTFVAAAASRGSDIALILPLGVWSLALGVRGILSHQMLDLANDSMSGVSTLAVRSGARRIARAVAFAVFPVETLGLVVLLGRVHAPLAWPLLAVHLFLVWQMARWLNIQPVLVQPTESFRFVLFKYYVTFFPATFILALAQSSAAALGLIAFHAAAFPGTWSRFREHAREVLRRRRNARRRARHAKSAGIRHAIERGLQFLAKAQLHDGEIVTLLDSSEGLENGIPDSSPFTTALVAGSLESCLPTSKPVIERALAFLEEHMEDGGVWRYYTRKAFKHTRIPPDLDDTACASHVLRSNRGRAPLNQSIFLSNRNQKGLFCTWLLPEDSEDEAFKSYLAGLETSAETRTPPMPVEFQGSARFYFPKDPVTPGEVDSVVNANVVFYLGENADTRPAIEYLIDLIKKKSERGSSFYYNDVMALYYMLARAARKSAPALREVAPHVAKRVAQRLKGSAGNLPPLWLSLAVCTLLTFDPHSPNLRAAIDLLLKAQQSDGSWPRCTFYRGPKEFWGSAELTTGFCLEALARYSEYGSRRWP